MKGIEYMPYRQTEAVERSLIEIYMLLMLNAHQETVNDALAPLQIS